MTVAPLVRIPVGIVVERSKAASPWIDYTWRPVAALVGNPAAAPWTVLAQDGETTTYFAGNSDICLFPTETAHYRDNLASGSAQIWVVLRPTDAEPPFALFMATADPAEGEGYTQAGNDLVEPVPMPDSVQQIVAAFVAEHHVETPFFKRKRERADPNALGRRGRVDEDER
jgi:uncharacterized protein DUF3305